jgi:two-component system response regulator RegA
MKKILLVDDDEVFCNVFSRALLRRNWDVSVANNVDQAKVIARNIKPSYSVIDLKMPGGSGLLLISDLLEINKNIKIVILTGYASIATAIEAIKLGATHYLVKPADTDEILASFYKNQGNCNAPIKENNMSANRFEWEHINKVLADNNGNISKSARILGIHRRSLQRKLFKRPLNN